MKRSMIFIFIINVLLLSTVATVNAVDESQQSIVSKELSDAYLFLQNFKTEFKSPDTDPVIAYSKIGGSTKYLAVDQAQVALNFLKLAEEANQAHLTTLEVKFIQSALATLKFETSYLINPLTRDHSGIIEFWDTNLQDNGLVRVSKIARDQALTLLAIDKLLTFIDNGFSVKETITAFYKETFTDLWSFLQSLYDTANGGWFTKTTAINQTAYSIDKTKRVADNMIIISSLTQIRHVSLLEKDFTNTSLADILDKSMNLFLTKFIVPNKGISSYGSADGSDIVTSSFFSKENTLFGLTCLDLYNLNNNHNETYLTEAQNIWSYIKVNFWAKGGFGGLFIGINSQGDVTIAGKSLEDQIFFALLSLRLSSTANTNVFMVSYIETNSMIINNFIKGNQVASSTDQHFNPSSEYYLRSVTYLLDYLFQTPHILAIIVPSSVIIGSNLPIKIIFSNNVNALLNLSISSSGYLDPYSQVTNETSLNIDLEFHNDITTGNKNVNFQISLLKTEIQSLNANVNFTPNVRIPNGLIYLIGAGILAGLVIIVRRPPAFLKNYLDELKEDRSTNVSENNSLEQ